MRLLTFRNDRIGRVVVPIVARNAFDVLELQLAKATVTLPARAVHAARIPVAQVSHHRGPLTYQYQQTFFGFLLPACSPDSIPTSSSSDCPPIHRRHRGRNAHRLADASRRYRRSSKRA